MNFGRISGIFLQCLPLKSHSAYHPTLSKGHLVLNWNLCTLSEARNKCHFSQLPYRQCHAANFISTSALASRDSLCFSTAFSYSAHFTSYRGLRGFPSNRVHQDSPNRIIRRHAELSGIDKSTVKEDIKAEGVNKGTGGEQDPPQSLTLYQRFKKTYREHGKILVAVHLLTSTVWLGSFYMLARNGFDIVPYLENWNFSEKVIKPFRSGGLGDVALAYLLYKLATPARYTVTIGGTNLAIRYLRKEGKIPQVPKEDSFRSLYKEGKEHLKKRSNARMRRLGRRNRNKQSDHLTKEEL